MRIVGLFYYLEWLINFNALNKLIKITKQAMDIIPIEA